MAPSITSLLFRESPSDMITYRPDSCFFCNAPSFVLRRGFKKCMYESMRARCEDEIGERLYEAVYDDHGAWFCEACECWNGHYAFENPELYQNGSPVQGRSSSIAASPQPLLRSKAAPRSSPFCRTCQRNQALIIGLMSTFGDDPVEEAILLYDSPAEAEKSIAEYRRSLEYRYPPVCADCATVVQERINLADQDARRRLMAGWLDQNHPAVQQMHEGESCDATNAEKSKFDTLSRWTERSWRIRGYLWLSVHASSSLLAFHKAAVAFPAQVPFSIRNLLDAVTLPMRQNPQVFAVYQIASLLWSAWDPSWNIARKEELRTGRRPWVNGKRIWLFSQLEAYALRLLQMVIMSERALQMTSAFQEFTNVFLRELYSLVRQSRTMPGTVIPGGETAASLSEGPSLDGHSQKSIKAHVGESLVIPFDLRYKALYALGISLICTSITLFAYLNLKIEKPAIVRLASRKLAPATVRSSSAFPLSSPPPTWPVSANGHVGEKAPESFGSPVGKTQVKQPVFGETSLPGASRRPRPTGRFAAEDEQGFDDSMDWQSEEAEVQTSARKGFWFGSSKPPSKSGGVHSGNSVIAPQRFFPPEAPTGLEDLFSSALDMGSNASVNRRHPAQVPSKSWRLLQVFAETLWRVVFTLFSFTLVLGLAWLVQGALMKRAAMKGVS